VEKETGGSMLTLPDHFSKFLMNIQPGLERVALAQAFPNGIRDYLQETDLIATTQPHSRLTGSYARYTAIKNIKDVDIILFADSSYRDEGDKGPEELLDDLVTALKGLPKALGDESGYIDAELALRRQRRSVNVCISLKGESFAIDVVPATLIDGINDAFWIPDKEWNKWIKSNPLGYGKYLNTLNKEGKDKVIHLMKMLKHWRDVRMIYRRPKSYWLECMVVKHIEDNHLVFDDKSHAELFADLIQAIYDDFLPEWEDEDEVPKISDPMLGNNVAWNWERAEFETFMRRVDESRKWASRALSCDSEEDAIELWQKVFNRGDEEYFPSTMDDTLKTLAEGSKAGTLRYTSTGIILSRSSPEIQSRESPPHRFYGVDEE
jgi:hypothetical protein